MDALSPPPATVEIASTSAAPTEPAATAELFVPGQSVETEQSRVDSVDRDEWESEWGDGWSEGAEVFEKSPTAPKSHSSERFDEVEWTEGLSPAEPEFELPSRAEMTRMLKDELLNLANMANVNPVGTKQEIIDRLTGET
jgi:hypothetical protein